MYVFEYNFVFLYIYIILDFLYALFFLEVKCDLYFFVTFTLMYSSLFTKTFNMHVATGRSQGQSVPSVH